MLSFLLTVEDFLPSIADFLLMFCWGLFSLADNFLELLLTVVALLLLTRTLLLLQLLTVFESFDCFVVELFVLVIPDCL